MTKYTVGSLFAGVGGICQAFKDISCNVLWANEIDKHSCKTYKLNHTETKLLEIDVKKITKDSIENVDILTAGFPCQPFSQAGHGKGFDDERGQLFFDVIRLLNDLKPKAYLLENVKTLATHNDGNSFNLVKDEIFKAGYSFIPFILNASEYSEIPQGRERIYMVGFRGESDYSYPRPIKVNSQMNFGTNYCSESFNIPQKMDDKPKSVREFLDNSTVIPEDYYNKLNNSIHQKIRDAVKNPNRVYQYRRYYVRENKSDVCPTLTANMGGGGHNIPIILDGGVPRRLTPKECFNLQGFPPDFKLPLEVARGQLYKQSIVKNQKMLASTKNRFH
jgi:DNA (cytosine-5)-methyltransferase 1